MIIVDSNFSNRKFLPKCCYKDNKTNANANARIGTKTRTNVPARISVVSKNTYTNTKKNMNIIDMNLSIYSMYMCRVWQAWVHMNYTAV